MYGYCFSNVKKMQYNYLWRHSIYLIDDCERRVRFDWVICEKFAIVQLWKLMLRKKNSLLNQSFTPYCLISYFPEIVYTVRFFMSNLSSVILAKNRQPESLRCQTFSFFQLHKIWTIFLELYHIYVLHHIHRFSWNIWKKQLLLLVIFINNHEHPMKSWNSPNFIKHSMGHCSLSSSSIEEKTITSRLRLINV